MSTLRRFNLRRIGRNVGRVLLIAVAACLVPPLLSRIDSAAKQRETIDDMRRVGKAIFEYVTDEAGAAAAGGSVFPPDESDLWDPFDYLDGKLSADELEGFLARVPDPKVGVVRYIDIVPRRDGWGRRYHYFLRREHLLAGQVAAIFSCGEPTGRRDCKAAIRTPRGSFLPQCYTSDIVWADGTFVHYPFTQGRGDGDLLRPRTCDHGAG